MRNLKRAISLAVASVMLMSMMVVGAGAASFKDAAEIDNASAATVLEALGIMTGDENGNFNPDQVVTRAEMASLLVRLVYGADYNTSNAITLNNFTDTVGHWGQGAIETAFAAGWISGYGDGTFGPDDSVKTYEAALMLQRALGYYSVLDTTNYNPYDGAVAVYAISLASQLSMFDGVSAGAYVGLTRDEVAVAMYNTLFECAKVGYSAWTQIYYSLEKAEMTNANVSVDFGAKGTFAYDVHDVTIGEGYDVMGRPTDTVIVDKEVLAENVKDVETVITSDTDHDDIEDEGDYDFDASETTLFAAGQKVSYENFSNYVFETKTPSSTTESKYGIVVEVYNYDDLSDKECTVYVAYQYFVDEIDDIDYDEDDNITTIDMDGQGDILIEGDVTDLYEEGDIVLFTYGLEDNKSGDDKYIDTLAIAEAVEGEVTAVSTNSGYVKLDGTTYYLSEIDKAVYGDFTYKTLSDSILGDTYALYLDPNGYVIFAEEVEATESVYDYLYINKAAASGFSIIAEAYFADGTSATITVSEVDGYDAIVTSGDGQVIEGMVYEFDMDGDEYELTAPAGATLAKSNGSAQIQGGYSKLYAGDWATGSARFDDETVFVDVEDGVTYTGYENVADYNANTTAGDIIALTLKDEAYALVVFMLNADTEGTTGTYVYMESLDRYTTKIDGDTYYVYEDAYVDGVNVDLVVEYNASFIGDVKAGGIYEIDTDSNGYVESFMSSALIASDFATGFTAGQMGFRLETVGGSTLYLTQDATGDFGTDERFIFDNDTVFVLVDLVDGDISVGDSSDLIVFDGTDEDYTEIVFIADSDAYLELVYIYYYDM